MNIRTISKKTAACVIAAIFIATGLIEHSMGRVPVYEHGPIAFWSGDVNSDQNSQQISDPYTFSHIIHGFAFYGGLSLVPGGLSIGAIAVGTTVIEAGWEILENSPIIINRYRAETASVGYSGDSILNSLFDIAACLLGFYIASKVSWKWTLGAVVVIEFLMLYLIRDNLTLNIVMLVYPIHAIKQWQLGL